MKISTFGFILIITLIGLTSCFDDEDFADEPRIELGSENGVLFRDIGDNNDADTLVVLVDFQDGDGDLGLDEDEDNAPFNLQNYFSNKTGQLFDFQNETFDDLMKFSDRAVIDTLPDLNDVTECLNWDLMPDLNFADGTPVEDTIYFQFNPRHFNFFVSFFVRNSSGEFEEFDIRLEFGCSTTFDGRFQVLVDENERGSLEGTIRYRMTSRFFKAVFGGDTPMFLRMQIVDRAGNFSNVIQTPEFTLNEITSN